MADRGWKLVTTQGTTRTIACWAGAWREDVDHLDMIWLVPPDEDDFSRLRQILIGDYRVYLDHARAAVHHHGFHTDPLFALMRNGKTCWEINLYRDGLLAAGQAILVFADGTQVVCPLIPASLSQETENFSTRLVDWPDHGRVVVRADQPTELIWQTMRFGRFAEQRQMLPPGDHDIEIPAFYADWLGLVISSRGLENPVEHKYMLSGTLGAASARWLVDGRTGRIYGPPQQHEFSFRSAVLWLDDEAPVPDLAGFHEVEVFLPVARPAPPIPPKTRLMRYADWGDDRVARADIIRLDSAMAADDPAITALPMHQAISYLLGHDSAAPDILARYQAALAALKTMPEDRLWLDRSWLGARVDPGDALPVPRYGMGFSIPRGLVSGEGDWPIDRARIAEKTRFLRRSSPCYDCPATMVTTCRQGLARPGPLLWPIEQTCFWRDHL